FLFFFYHSPPLPPLHSFPTRRSSDLSTACSACACQSSSLSSSDSRSCCCCSPSARSLFRSSRSCSICSPSEPRTGFSFSSSSTRSEEHTSELQSPYDLVCRLLLEKKK